MKDKKEVKIMKKFLLLLTIMFAGFGLLACTDSNKIDYSDYTYLSLEMNPSVDFIIDENDKVFTYHFRNEEAEVIAAGLDLIGKNYEEALHLYLNAAIDTGFIDVERADGAVMIQAGGKNDATNESFMLQVQTTLQTFFYENAIGAVVLKGSEVDEAAKELVDTYEITYGTAKLILAYMEDNEEALIEDVLEMDPKDLLDGVITKANQYRDLYLNQIEAAAQTIKDELVEALQLQVQAHRSAVIDATKEQPDISGLKANYLENFDEIHQAYVNRNQTRLQEAKTKASEKNLMVFSLEINPSVDFVVDGNGLVLSYYFKNEDAEIVGAGLRMEGMDYQEALNLYLNAAVDTGYLDIEREDNAVMIQNSGVSVELENAFMNQTKTMMQKFFYENAIGAVVLSQHEINPEIEALAEEYNVSYGFVKLVLSYLETDETLVLEEVILMTSAEIIEIMKVECQNQMIQYRNQVEENAQKVKYELVEALQSRVQQHRSEVENETKTQSDISGLKEMYLADFENMHQQFVNRNQVRVQQAKESQGKNPV